MKYKHILYPSDGSSHSLKALEHVKIIAKEFSSQITILVVYQQPFSIVNNYNALPMNLWEQYKQENKVSAEKIAKEALSILVTFGISNVDFKVVEGNQKLLICEYANKLGVDLIIMGSRGHTSGNYIGSTSTYVINNTPGIPVLVVG
ncbi:MAG: universal stress protein UspA [Candidatus Sericytochromatia bacterium]|nr:MAG: universal stress protein UspA [Candidatus Sericytochromatia bacterium]